MIFANSICVQIKAFILNCSDAAVTNQVQSAALSSSKGHLCSPKETLSTLLLSQVAQNLPRLKTGQRNISLAAAVSSVFSTLWEQHALTDGCTIAFQN